MTVSWPGSGNGERENFVTQKKSRRKEQKKEALDGNAKNDLLLSPWKNQLGIDIGRAILSLFWDIVNIKKII